MADMHVAVVPVGKVDAAEVEAAVARVARLARRPFELRRPLPVPAGTEDPERRQHRAAVVLTRLAQGVAKLAPGRMIGENAPDKPPSRPAAFLFVTDVDLYTAKSEGVMAVINSRDRVGIVSLRRLREAFWRRRADPVKQRTRLVKEIARVWARLAGAAECADPTCILAPSRNIPDVDTKGERFCRVCSQRLFEGKVAL